MESIIDFLTGRSIGLAGAEENRQAMAKYLVETLGYAREDIVQNYPLELEVAGEPYTSRIDLVVRSGGQSLMAICCVAGSISSYEREIIAAARIAEDTVIPLAAVTDGVSLLLFDAVSGAEIGNGLATLPAKSHAEGILMEKGGTTISGDKREKMKIVFRTYDMDRVNLG